MFGVMRVMNKVHIQANIKRTNLWYQYVFIGGINRTFMDIISWILLKITVQAFLDT